MYDEMRDTMKETIKKIMEEGDYDGRKVWQIFVVDLGAKAEQFAGDLDEANVVVPQYREMRNAMGEEEKAILRETGEILKMIHGLMSEHEYGKEDGIVEDLRILKEEIRKTLSMRERTKKFKEVV